MLNKSKWMQIKKHDEKPKANNNSNNVFITIKNGN